ncbi:MAG: type I-C CRISPR-associated endonuclease Cas1c [Pseudomonadota bacterium]
MRRHLNTLYVTSDEAWLRKDGENVVVEVEGEVAGRVPLHHLGGIVAFGRAGLSMPLIGHCADQGTTISLMTGWGKFRARIDGPVSGNILLRRAQYAATQEEAKCSSIVRSFVTAKMANQRQILTRFLREHRDDTSDEEQRAIEDARGALAAAIRACGKDQSTDVLRGHEGEGAAAYFGVFRLLIRRPDFGFQGRTRRPPTDPVNALLSLTYALLTHDCRSALESVGLDPQAGFLHRDRPGRPSLALDLAEEFRASFADRFVLSLINRRQVQLSDFETKPGGAVVLKDKPRKEVLAAYQEKKRAELTHSFIGEKTTTGLLWFLQAQLLARHIRGELDAYPPFLLR